MNQNNELEVMNEPEQWQEVLNESNVLNGLEVLNEPVLWKGSIEWPETMKEKYWMDRNNEKEVLNVPEVQMDRKY